MTSSAEPLTVRLEKHAYGGAALGRLSDGRAVFVPFSLPGEEVRISIIEQARGHARAELLEVLQPSADRIQPRCPHFGTCGGCAYQHTSYARQLELKTTILRDQFERLGGIQDAPVTGMVASPVEWNYRNHVQFHLTRDGKPGYMAADGHGVMPIQECHLPEAGLNALWPSLEFDPGLKLQRVSLRQGAGGQAMLVLESGESPELELEADISVVHLREGEIVVMAGQADLDMSVLGRTFRVSAGSFFQVNTAMAEKMVEHLLKRLPLSPAATVLDVYCGAGLFSAFLAPRVGRLIGIEAAPSACEDFTVNLDEFDNVELYEAAAEHVLPTLRLQPEVVLVDPPRAGLERKALEAITAMHPGMIAYVSCDPATLARDAKRLIEAGYRMLEVTAFDLFPQTYHIESITLFAG